MEPGGRQPAPGPLATVQAFINTTDIEGGTEELASPGALRDWLAARGLLPTGATLGDDDLDRALAAREALRDLLAANHGDPVEPSAVETLNRLAPAAALRVRFSPDGRAALAPAAPGLDGALGRLLAIVHDATLDGTWARLKVCRNDVCRWAFYDASKNRSGAWCTMAICGSRLKVRAYRQRRRASGRPPG